MNYTITAMSHGYMNADSSVLMLRTKIGVPNKNTMNIFLVQGGGENILIDTGSLPNEINPPERAEYTSLEGYRPVKEVIEEQGIKCSDITRIIYTHLHYDHCWNLELFPKDIPIYIQGREMEYAMNPIPWDERIYSFLPGSDVPPWLFALGRIVRVDGDKEILPGIKLLLTPGHSKGSQSVLIDTKEGKYLCTGDFLPRIESYEKQIPNGIINNLYEWTESYNKVHDLVDGSDKILPCHEHLVLNRKVYG